MSKPRNLNTSAPRKSEVPPGYVADPSKGPMLRYEASLPKLPIPPVSSTAAKYLETVEPHLTPEQFAKTQAAVKAGIISSVNRYKLTRRLVEVAESPSSVDDATNESILWYELFFDAKIPLKDISYDRKFCQLLRAGIEDSQAFLLLALVPNV